MIIYPVAIPAIGVTIAGATFALQQWRGQIKMTPPNEIRFGYYNCDEQFKKVELLTMLYVKSNKGRYIQSMYLRLHRNTTSQDFTDLYIGNKQLVRGSSMFIGSQRTSEKYHFVLPEQVSEDIFIGTKYVLEVFVELTNGRSKKIFEQKLEVPRGLARLMKRKKADLVFTRVHNTREYGVRLDSPSTIEHTNL